MHIVKNNMFPTPPLFSMIQKASGTSWHEMYKVFNMGHRFEIYIDEKSADKLISISRSFGVDARVVGYCVSARSKSLRIESDNGIFEY